MIAQAIKMYGAVIQLLLGVMITVSIALGGWALKTAIEHESRISTIEARQEATNIYIIERIDRMETALTARIDRLEAKLDGQ